MPTIVSSRTKRSTTYNTSGREYDFIAALRSSIDLNGADPVGVEGEVAAALADNLDPARQRGFAVPLDALTPKHRSLSSTTGSGAIGSRLAGTGSWTDVLRSKAALGRLGAEFFPAGAQPILFPTKASGTTAGWIAEGDDLTPSAPELTPDAAAYKTVGGGCIVTKKMLASAPPGVLLDYIAAELAASVGSEIDHAAFVGAGGVQPIGFFAAASGVPVYELGANGAVPARLDLVKMMRTVHAANGDAPADARMGWAAGVNAEAKLRTVDGSSGGAGAWLWTDADSILGRPAVATTGIPDTFAKGTGTGLSGLVYGNFRDVLVVHPPAVQIVVDPYTLGPKGMIRIFAYLDVHFVVRHAASFVLAKDVVTTP